MRFTIEQHFAGPLERVEGALVDPAFLDRLSTLPKLGRPTLVHRVEAGEFVHQWVKYAFVGDLNAAVRRVVDPARLTWVEESTLDRRTHETTWRIVPDHYKNLLRAVGTFLLVEVDAGRTRRVAEGDLKVTVPLVGGKVEHAIVSGLREHAALEEGVLDDWLAQHP
ncbi:MAG TPA: DUF2505 family protein [Acidimicrobiales bacterium]|nr:DUF2505 family protein [Acidimicrobiales bacterium]